MIPYLIEQNHCAVLESKGRFNMILESGWHFLNLTDYISTVDLSYFNQQNKYVTDIRKCIFKGRERLDIPPYRGLSQDNLPLYVDLSLEIQISDVEKVCYGIDKPFLLLQDLVSSRIAEISTRTELNTALKDFAVFQKKLAGIQKTSIESFGIKVHRIIIQSIETNKETMAVLQKVTQDQHAKISKLRLTEMETQAMKMAQESRLVQIEAEMKQKQKQSECDAKVAFEAFERQRQLEEKQLAWRLESKKRERDAEIEYNGRCMEREAAFQSKLCKELGEGYSAYSFSNAILKASADSKIIFMPPQSNNIVPCIQ